MSVSCTSFAQQLPCVVQSIITVVTGWYAMNLNNMHPQSFPWFYSVGVALRSVTVTPTVLSSQPQLVANRSWLCVCRSPSCPSGSVSSLTWPFSGGWRSSASHIGYAVRMAFIWCQNEVILICSTLLKRRYCWWKKLMFQ
jgi:hypothetical protein